MRALPTFNIDLLETVNAQLARFSLETLLRFSGSSDGFKTVFNTHPANYSTTAEVRHRWARDLRCREAISVLTGNGLLPDDDGPSPFLVSREPSCYFYMTDRPDTGHADEVFSLHLEQRALSNALLARPDDTVLDLGTGCGILLLEAVHRGGHGVGIDINDRALLFARTNAAINGVSDRVAFESGDMTVGPRELEWGKPDLIISNPPFDPTIPGDDPPLHSASGPLGDRVLNALFDTINTLPHPPRAIQLVLYSLASHDYQQDNSPKWLASPMQYNPQDLHFWGILEKNSQSLGALLDAHEVAPPMSITDFLTLHHGTKEVASRTAWLHAVQSNLGINERQRALYMHLFVANFLVGRRRGVPVPTAWGSWKKGYVEEECFILPSASRGNSDLNRLYACFARPSILGNLDILEQFSKLNLALEQTRGHINTLVRDIIASEEDVFLADVTSNSTGRDLVRVQCVPGDRSKKSFYFELPSDQFTSLLQHRWHTMGATVCDVVPTTPVLRTHLEAGSPPALFKVWLKPKECIKRFVAVSSWPDGCLTPVRQEFFADMLFGAALKS